MAWFRLVVVLVATFASSAFAGDWPMWRYDSRRGASTPHGLPQRLHLQWRRELPPARPAWPDTQTKLKFDVAPEPVVMGRRIFVPSSVNDSLTAYDTASGRELWRFYAEGPVRFAAVADQGRVYFVSDDGHLYCLRSEDGRLEWKVRGAPGRRRLIGNHRLISAWPARGGVVLHQGKLHFAAGIWPFMGIFVHAVDPASGEVLWTNSGDGTNYTAQPHGGAVSFATVAPHGHLVADVNHLIVPGGRSTPAVYDTTTGKLDHFRFDKRTGGHAVSARHGAYFVGGKIFRGGDGQGLGAGSPSVIDDKLIISASGGRISVSQFDGLGIKTVTDRRGNKTSQGQFKVRSLFTVSLEESPGEVFIKAGSRLYTGGKDGVAAYELEGVKDGQSVSPSFRAAVDGDVWNMLAADDRLFVVTRDSKLYCFGADQPPQPMTYPLEQELPAAGDESRWTAKTREILTAAGVRDGYAVALGIGSGGLIKELLRQSNLYVLAVDPDAAKVNALRRRLQSQGLYGRRASAHVGDPAEFPLPSYLANVIVSEEGETYSQANAIDSLFKSLRPYGGVLCLATSDAAHQRIAGWTNQPQQPQAKLRRQKGLSLLARAGPLPGSDNWTHQYGNAAQTAISGEALVKPPLGVLWFGGPTHEGILPRHGHGPSPQVAGGRLFIEGADMLRAVDVYTGRVLWEKSLPEFGKYYNTTRHFPGAGEIGGNYVSLPDRVYAVYGDAILELDAANGKTLKQFKLAAEQGRPAPNWGFLAVWEDLLVATSSPVGVGTSIASSTADQRPKVPSGYQPLIPHHAKWRYFTGSDPQGTWNATDYDDDGWKSGAAGFGFGDGDDKTRLDLRGRFSRIYIRHSFDGKQALESKGLALSINYDDGFVAYLNGREVARGSVLLGSGAAAIGVRSHEAEGFEVFPIKNWKRLVRPGKNVLAIEGHNRSRTSSDMSLDPILLGRRESTSTPAASGNKQPATLPSLPPARYGSGSRRLVVFHRHTGKLLWRRDAQFNFRHNNIAVAAGKVFCIDSLTDSKRSALARRGVKLEGKPALYALNAKSGDVVWSTSQNVFGTFLNYSPHHDILLQAGSRYRDRAKDEIGSGMAAYRGQDGKLLWRSATSHGGPCLLWRDRILTNGGGGFAVDIKTGAATGWKYRRTYGCNTALGCQNLLTFRSGAAGFCDLLHDSGTGNFGGFRSSCTNNLIPADGVLNAPDYTRTCSCAYQLQTSLALIHDPDAEYWTFGGEIKDGKFGLNFGAPGDRRDKSGVMWLEYPMVGGASQEVAVQLEPKQPEVFRAHSSTVRAGELKWVAANGLSGIRRVNIKPPRPGKYQVKLHFLEPSGLKPGERVFDVELQGRLVLKDFDVAAAAGGARRAVVKTFPASTTGNSFTIDLAPKTGRPPVLSGVELLEAR